MVKVRMLDGVEWVLCMMTPGVLYCICVGAYETVRTHVQHRRPGEQYKNTGRYVKWGCMATASVWRCKY
jgi:hypothetical protein